VEVLLVIRRQRVSRRALARLLIERGEIGCRVPVRPFERPRTLEPLPRFHLRGLARDPDSSRAPWRSQARHVHAAALSIGTGLLGAPFNRQRSMFGETLVAAARDEPKAAALSFMAARSDVYGFSRTARLTKASLDSGSIAYAKSKILANARVAAQL